MIKLKLEKILVFSLLLSGISIIINLEINHDFNKLLNGKDGVCIYIKFAFLKFFFFHVLPKLNYKFILIKWMEYYSEG